MLMSEKIQEAHARIEATHESPLMCIILIGKMHEHYTAKYQQVMSDLKKYHPDLLRECGSPLSEQGVLRMEKWLQSSVEKGYIREDVDVRLAAMTMNMTLEHMLSSTLMFDYTHTEVINEFMANYIRGLLTKKAVDEFEEQRPQLKEQISKMKFN